MKKIGILTYFGDLNSGTNLQAYSLLTALQNKLKNHYTVEIINYHPWNRIWEWHPYMTSISINSLKNDIIRLSKYRDFIKNNLNLTPKRMVAKDPKIVWNFIKQRKYDALYIGSDTLLELDRYASNEISAFWLPPEIETNKFLVAASSKNLDFRNLSKYQKEKIGDSINSLSLLGVRDEATARLIRNFIPQNDKRLEIIPDPTFSLNIDYKFVEKYLSKKKVDLGKPTICLHLTKDTSYSFTLANTLRQKGFQIASLRPAYYADILLNDLSPFELIGVFKYFKAVVTHRFHDSVFCLKNLTPVITVPYSFSYTNTFNESKYTSLFRTFNIYESNLINTMKENTSENICYLLEKTISEFPKKSVDSKLNEMHASFYEYLDKTFEQFN